MSEPKLNIKEETSTKKTRSPPKKAKVEQTVPKKKKLKTDADKAAEKAQHLRFGKVELTPDELSRLSMAQKREDVRRPCRPVCGAPGNRPVRG